MIEHIHIPKIQDADLKDKVVLVRVDHNVVKKGVIYDPYRIDATIGTLYHINAKGGKIILMSHIGRPKDKKSGRIAINEHTSVEPIVEYLESKLHINIKIPDFYRDHEKGYLGIETSVNHLIKELKSDKIDCIYLPNTRWFYGEESSDEDSDRFARQLAGLADVFVNDAFGSWQPHTSTTGVNKYLPSYAGFLMQREINNLDRIYNPKRPFVAVVAGSKFDTKIEPLYSLLEKADHLVLGGVIYNAYLCTKYGISIKGVSEDDTMLAAEFVKKCNEFPGKLIELPYIIESDTIEGRFENQFRVRDIRYLEKEQELNYVLDISSRSFDEEYVKRIFSEAQMIFVNAVMGLTPHFNEGTLSLDQLIDENSNAVKLYGGGDTMQELKRLLPGLYIVALDSPSYYIFTGGGAVLKAIQEDSVKGLAPVKALLANNN